MKGAFYKGTLKNKPQAVKRTIEEEVYAEVWHSEVKGYTVSLNQETMNYEFKLWGMVIGVHKWTKGMGEKGSMKALLKAVKVFND